MTKYTFTYKDWHGRTNKADRYADNEFTATEKFRVLYPNTTILSIQ